MKCFDGRYLLTKADIAALTEFASTDRTRPALAGVRFSPLKGSAVATDGHSLVCATNGAKYAGKPFTAPAKFLAEAAKVLKKNDHVYLHEEGGNVVAQLPDGSERRTPAVTIDYPDWEQVMPSEGPEFRVSSPTSVMRFDCDMLARLAIVQKAALKFPEFRTPEDELSALLAVFDSRAATGSTWRVLLMPVRG